MSGKGNRPNTVAPDSFWRPRAQFVPHKGRPQRQAQLRRQITWLAGVLAVVIAAAAIVIATNWRNAGASKTVSCADYPDYCVPLAGGAPGHATLEAASVRTLDQDSAAAPGVVRGIADDTFPFVGDPDAPIHFRVVSNYACSHCNTYHTSDLRRFHADYVLTGQATLSAATLTGLGGAAAQSASEAAFCAGEQGAYWEIDDELYRLARTRGVDNGFDLAEIKRSAAGMGLDGAKLLECVAANRYRNLLLIHQSFAVDHGVTGTPTLLVRYAGADSWTALPGNQRSYDNMAALTEAANAR